MIRIVLRLQGMKKRVAGAQRAIENGTFDRRDDKPSARMRERHRVDAREYRGRTVWTVSPKAGGGEKRILYLHGGGYVNGFAWLHWHFISNLVGALRCTVVAPDYPLAPEHDVRDAFAMVFPLYEELLAESGAENLVVMGDSAGAGMGLALAMRARDEGLAQPSQIVLLSPWLDVTMTSPEAEKIDKLDPFLDLEGLKYMGRVYAGATDPKSYLVSPLRGSLRALAPVTLLIGTHDLFVADCRAFKAKAEAENLSLDYHEYENMVHVWMLMSSPEAREATRVVVEKLGRTG